MAQAGYTPIQLYYSTTASAAPSSGNLANGELAINITDGKLYYKDNGGTVRVLAGTGGTGVVAGSNTQVQFNNNGVFGASSGLTWDGTNLTASQLRSSGLTSGRVTYATTSGLLTDSANMTFNGTRLTVADLADSSLTSGRVTYANTGGNLTDSANLTFDGTNLTLGGGTANGVAYLNGSKVLTTGSALTFDGTNKLSVLSSAASDGFSITNGGATPATFSVYTGALSYGVSIGNGLTGAGESLRFDPTAHAQIFNINSSEQMRLTSTGLGIGTSSPSQKLDVYGNAISVRDGTFNGLIGRGASVVSGGAATDLGITTTTGNILFSTGGSFAERVRIDSSGNLLVGTTVATYNAAGRGVIEVNGGSTAIMALKINGGQGGYTYHDGSVMSIGNVLNGPMAFFTNNSEKARIDSSGNLLVGKTSAVVSSGGAGWWIGPNGFIGTNAANSLADTYNYFNNTAGVYRFYVTNAGVINATSTTITAISDQRLKENIQDIDVGLDKIMALKPRKFDWKAGKGKDIRGDRGWIAQEFEQVFPEMITTWKDEPPEGEEPYKAVNADLIPVLVKAIQEQQAIINQLKARLDAANL